MFHLLDLEALLPDESSPEYQAQLAVVHTYCQKIQAVFSRQFLDDFWEEAAKLSEIAQREHFLWGLHLGAQLTLQLLAPPPLSKNPPP